MFSSRIIPAIIPQSEGDLRQFVGQMHGIPELHVDVVDGKFVPHTSWPYEPLGQPENLLGLLQPFTLEVDLMVTNPIQAAETWIKAGADMLVFHIETLDCNDLKYITDKYDVTVGVAANNDTPLATLVPYLAYAHYVQVMGIASIGAQGQPFDERACSRIEEIRQRTGRHSISLDGCVNGQTLPRLVGLKLDRYIMGSAIYSASDPLLAYKQFSQLVSSTGE